MLKSKNIKHKLYLIFFTSICISIFMINLFTKNSYAAKPSIKNWLCYYATSFGPEIYSAFDLVVFDSHNHPPLPEKGSKSPIVLGYLSIGEVNVNSNLWPMAKEQPYLIKKNEMWDSWFVDVRDPEWQRILFEVAIPKIFEKGFDGLFLDTFDSTLSLITGEDAEKYKGVDTALKKIVFKIKKRFKNKLLAINRGLPLLPEIATKIDFVTVESLYSYYAGEEKGYIYVDDYTRNILLDQVSKGVKLNKNLVVLSLDYAGNEQFDLAKEGINFSKKRGFIPYVSTYKLDEIFLYTVNN